MPRYVGMLIKEYKRDVTVEHLDDHFLCRYVHVGIPKKGGGI